ncbi:hypothetical protein TNCV_2390001 [Trichonephila clavipes]|nr:hypothetical protein TNCV_2390001 [Trichonephila clavipes]
MDPKLILISPEVRSCLKVAHFTSVEGVQEKKLEALLKGLPKTSFQNCYQQRQYRTQKYVNAEEDYFEGDTVMGN